MSLGVMLLSVQSAVNAFKKDVVENFGNFPSYFMGLVNEDGSYNHHDGYLRIIDSQGNIIVDKADPRKYYEYIGEASLNHSYLKAPYILSKGFPEGMYRVGPLARLNIAKSMGTPLADKELKEFKSLSPNGVVLSSFYYHYARLIEILHCYEQNCCSDCKGLHKRWRYKRRNA